MTTSGVCLLALVMHVAAADRYWLCEIFGRSTEPWRLAASDDVELDTTATTWLGDTVSFRWAILHMIEEAARHAGHADLIRERIDNTTGHLPPENLPY